MKQKGLTIAMSCLFLFVIIFFGIIIVQEKGNLFLSYQAKKELTRYINERYQKEKENFHISDINFDKNQNRYFLILHDKKDQDLSFTIFYAHNKQITDTYETEYLNKKKE